MKISVAIATYNRLAMVRESIEAALEQTLLPGQIIVSDDASTDGTASMLEEWAARETRVRVLRQTANSGGVENWNIAMRAAAESGDYMAWCSDDDRFTPEHLRTTVEFLERHPGIGMAHSSFIDSFERDGVEALREPRRLRSRQPIVIGAGSFLRYMARYYDWPFHPSTIVMRREVWNRVGEFDRSYQLADTDWFVRAALTVQIAWLPRHGAINRRHAGNWSNKVGGAGMQREIFSIVEGAIASRPFVKRAISRALWRATVRARLLLTLRDRIRGGHGDAACAAWSAMAQGTGRRLPDWITRWGEGAIRKLCGRGEGEQALRVRPL